jgi:hypothetical protein
MFFPCDAATLLRHIRREAACDACSEPHRERILAIQRSIRFSDVLEKMRELADDETH